MLDYGDKLNYFVSYIAEKLPQVKLLMLRVI